MKRPVPSPPPEDTLSSTDVRRFPTPADHRNLEKACSKRKVLVERIFYRRFIEELNFNYLDRLEKLKWWNLACLQCDVNVNLVRMFYFLVYCRKYDYEGNLKDGENTDEFRTKVLDEEFVINNNGIRRKLRKTLKEEVIFVCPGTLITLKLANLFMTTQVLLISNWMLRRWILIIVFFI